MAQFQNVPGASQAAFDALNTKLTNYLTVEKVNHQITWYSTGNPFDTSTFEISKSGYTPIGIVGQEFTGSLNSYISVSNMHILYLNSKYYVVYQARLTGSPSSTTQNTMDVYILYVKN